MKKNKYVEMLERAYCLGYADALIQGMPPKDSKSLIKMIKKFEESK